MDGQSSLERVRGQLKRRGLPRDYVERVVNELDDHRADLEAEARRNGSDIPAAERLGAADSLCEAVVTQYQRRTLVGRHPVLTLLVAPAAATVLLRVVGDVVLAMVAVGLGLELTGSMGPGLIGRAVGLMLWIVPPSAVMLVVLRLSRRSGRGGAWLAGACLSVALVAGFLVTLVSVDASGHGAWQLGLGFPPRQPWLMAVPVAIAALHAGQTRRLSRRAVAS